MMASARLVHLTRRNVLSYSRPFATSSLRYADVVPLNSRANDTAEKHRKYMMEKPLNPHMTNTNSTIANEMPSIGADKPPADMLSSVDPKYKPTDSVPENTHRMTGGTQSGKPQSGANADLDVGEMEGSSMKVEPMRRTGEDLNTTRARPKPKAGNTRK